MKTKGMFRRILSLLMCLCVVLGLFNGTIPPWVQAREDVLPEEKSQERGSAELLVEPKELMDLQTPGTELISNASKIVSGDYYFILGMNADTKGTYHAIEAKKILSYANSAGKEYQHLSHVTIPMSNNQPVQTNLDYALLATANSAGTAFSLKTEHYGYLYSFEADSLGNMATTPNAITYYSFKTAGTGASNALNVGTGTMYMNHNSYSFRTPNNANTTDKHYDMYVYHLSPVSIGLFKSLKTMIPYAYGNIDGRFDQEAYDAFQSKLREAVDLYKANRTVLSNATLKTQMTQMATALENARKAIDPNGVFLDYTDTIADLAAPKNELFDLSADALVASSSKTKRANGTYYFVQMEEGAKSGYMLDLHTEFSTTAFAAQKVLITNNSVNWDSTDEAIVLLPAASDYRFMMKPYHGYYYDFREGPTIHRGYMEEIGFNDNSGTDTTKIYDTVAITGQNKSTYHYFVNENEEIILEYFGDTSNGWPKVDGSSFALFRVAAQSLELYDAIQRVLPYAYGNTDGRYPTEEYSSFIDCLITSVSMYNENNRVYHTDLQQEEEAKGDMDEQAEKLLAYVDILTHEDTVTEFIDIPVEILDFRADSILFEYEEGAYNFRSQVIGTTEGKYPGRLVSKAIDNVVATGNTETVREGATEPKLINGQLIYDTQTVAYVARVMEAKYRYDHSELAPGMNMTYYNILDKISSLGTVDATIQKATPKENGGVLKWADVTTYCDLAYYLMNNLWRAVDEGDLMNKNSLSSNAEALPYNTVVKERDTLRMYRDETTGLYTLDSSKEMAYDGYFISNAVPVRDTEVLKASPYFTPIDGLGFEKPVGQTPAVDTDRSNWFYDYRGYDSENSNFHFTLHAHGSFVYYEDQNLHFKFSGDDDVHFFINGEIAMDLGGAHTAVMDELYLNSFTFKDGSKLQEGKVYTFDMFYAERHTTASNLKFSTNINIVDTETLTTKGQYAVTSNGTSVTDLATGLGGELIDNALVAMGDTIAYSFDLKNIRTVPVYDLTFTDESLGTYVSSTSVILCDTEKTNGAETRISDLAIYYRTVDSEGNVNSDTPVLKTADEIFAMLDTAMDGETSLPQGSYRVLLESEEQLMELLAKGCPRDCLFSLYGFRRFAGEGDSPYKNTMNSSAHYIRKDIPGEVFTVTGAATRIYQVTGSIPTVAAKDLVLDYGKPLQIPVDAIRNNIRTDGISLIGDLAGISFSGYNGQILKTAPMDLSCKTTGTSHTTEVGTFYRSNAGLEFRLTDFMEQTQRIWLVYKLSGCKAMDESGRETEYKYFLVEVTLIPANVMYYESDFAEGVIQTQQLGSLFFDFTNTQDDQVRYNSPTYGYVNYDAKNWVGTYNNSTKKYESATLSDDVLSVGKSPYTYTYVQTGGTEAKRNMYYYPQGAEVLYVRFKLDEGLTIGADAKIRLDYMEENVKNAIVGTTTIPLDDSMDLYGDFVLVKAAVTDKDFLEAKYINAIRLNFWNLEGSGSIHIDSIYIGPEKDAPLHDHLFFGFTNSATDRKRYEQAQYGGKNFDIGSWSYRTVALSAPVYDNTTGTMSVESIPNTGSEYYVQVSPGLDKPFVLQYDPVDAEVVKLRLKLEGFSARSLTPQIIVRYYTGNSKNVNPDDGISDEIHEFTDFKEFDANYLKTGDYFEIKLDVKNSARSAGRISALRFSVLNVTVTDQEKQPGKITFDYIYVGSEEDSDRAFESSNSQWSVVGEAEVAAEYQDVEYYGTAPTEQTNAMEDIAITEKNATTSFGAQDARGKLSSGTPIVFSHRANWRKAPENSLAAIYESILLGSDAVELDVQLSKDGVLVLNHDTSVARCCMKSSDNSKASGAVSDLEWNTLKTYYLRSYKGFGLGYTLTQEQADALNQLTGYSEHYGSAATAGGRMYLSRLDDALEMVTAFGPDTLISLDKCNSSQVFAAVYVLVREYDMLENVYFKSNKTAATLFDEKDNWFEAAATAWNTAHPGQTTTAQQVADSIMYLYYVGSGASVSNIDAHLKKGSYLKAVELTYTDITMEAEAGLIQGFEAHCLNEGIKLFCSTLAEEGYYGGDDNSPTWLKLLERGYSGIQTDRDAECVAFLQDLYRTRNATESIRAEHMDACTLEKLAATVPETADENGNMIVRDFRSGDTLTYELQFTGAEKTLTLYAQGLHNSVNVRFYADSIHSDNCIASFTLKASAHCLAYTENLLMTVSSGVHQIYMVVYGQTSYDLANIDGFTFGATGEDSYLFFDFGTDGKDQERYTRSIYGGNDFTDISNWYDNNGVSKDVAGMSDGNLTLDISTKDRDYHYFKTGTSWEALPLNYTIGANTYCKLRFRIDDAVISDVNKKMEIILYTVIEGVEGASNNPGVDTKIIVDWEDILDKGFVEYSFPVKSRAVGKLQSVQIFFNKLHPAEGKTAKITLDYLYIGPMAQEDSLYFSFDNTAADRDRYHQDVYGRYNFDDATNGYWGTNATGTQSDYTIDNKEGTVTIPVTYELYSGESNYGPKLMTSTTHGIYPWTGRGSYAPLNYDPYAAEVLQVRFKIDDCMVASGKNPKVQIDYHFDDDNGTDHIVYADVDYFFTYEAGKWMTATFELTERFRSVHRITSIGLRFVHIRSKDSDNTGTVTIDYIYVGPKGESPADLPLFTDFTDTEEDRLRYEQNPAYLGHNFDLTGNWSSNAGHHGSLVADNANGTVSFTMTPTGYEKTASVYLQSGPDIMRPRELNYNPENAEYAQIRFKLHNYIQKPGTTDVRVTIHYYTGPDSWVNDEDTVVTASDSTRVNNAGALNGEYVTVRIPLRDNIRSEKKISGIRFSINNIVSKSIEELGTVTVDYLYIGSAEALPDIYKTVYGYDSTYTEDGGFSNDTALYVKGKGVPNDYNNSVYTEASFDFTGTGFDIISRTGKEQATIRVEVRDSNGNGIKSMTVNNKGELELSQIPVVSVQGLAHGRYTVKLWVNKATQSPIALLNRGGDFYLDAIRIYDPINGEKDVLTEHELIAQRAYRRDGEAWAYVKEVRDTLLSEAEYSNATLGSNGTDGALFVDSTDFSGSGYISGVKVNDHIAANVDTYNKVGPKNEVYLAPGEAVAFKLILDTKEKPMSVDIGAKTILGDSALLAAGFVSLPDLTGTGLKVLSKVVKDLRSGTSMYYALDDVSIPQSGDVYLVLYNAYRSGDKTKNILSITDLKVAYGFKPTRSDLPDDDNTILSKDTESWKRGTALEEPLYRFEVDGYTLEAAAVFMNACLEETPVDDPLTVDGEVTIRHSLDLSADISVNYLISKDELGDYDSFYLEAEVNGQSGVEALTLLPESKGNYYYFVLNGVTAVEMNDTITATLHMRKGEQEFISETDEYSVASYAYSQLNKEGVSQSLKTLCADLLRYGAKAQLYKDYATNSLADGEMTELHRQYLSDAETVTFGNHNRILEDLKSPAVTWAGKSLDLASKVSLKLIFDPGAYAEEAEELSVRISYLGIDGEQCMQILTAPTVYNESKGWYAFTFDGLVAAELRSVVSAQIYHGEAPVSCTLEYSPDTYGNNKTGTLLTLCKALFAYSDSARRFFGA